jgi:carboxyl-terminal processing protease
MSRSAKTLVLLAALFVAACGSDGGGPAVQAPPVGGTCSVDTQKQFVLDNMLFWYLWNDRLPTNVDINDYSTPEELLAFLSTFSPDTGNGPVDRFSFLTTATSDQQFFGEGRFEGFGFSYRFVADNDYRLTRVFEDSPAFVAGLRRGQQFITLNGQTVAELEAGAGIDSAFDETTVTGTVRPVGGNADGSDDITISMTRAIVTIDPLPQWRIIEASGGRRVGYIEFQSFISTATPLLETVFAEFTAQNVNEVILDLRYNGGGLVSLAELLGDYLGGRIATGRVFSSTEFNAARASNNVSEFFELIGSSLVLDELVVITSGGTASASELVINGLIPHATVTIVGANTFGKPVGQIGLELDGCDVLLRPTSFQTVNSLGDGDFFDGLPVSPSCDAEDDLSKPVGAFTVLGAADNDPNLEKAMQYLETGSCPSVVSLAEGSSKPFARVESRKPELKGPPSREFANAR